MVKPLGRISAAFFSSTFSAWSSGDAGRDGALDLGGVELLEAVQRARLRGALERGKGGELHELPAGAAHVVVLQLVGVEPLGALDLRDDLVAAALDG